MIQNYFKIAWRNIRKHEFYSAVNIIGLFAGILFSFLIGAYVWQELQVNKKLTNADRQYILTSVWKDPNMGFEIATLGPLAKRLKDDYPNLVKNYYRFDGITSAVSKGDKHFRENIQLGDSTLLTMYGFKLLYGNASTALNEPYAVVLTKNNAIKYFGKTDVIGQTISIESFGGETHDFIITGVLDNIPENSVTVLSKSYPNTIFVPTAAFAFFGRTDLNTWQNRQIVSYIELQNNVTVPDIQKAITQLLKQNTQEEVQKNLVVRPIALVDYYLQKDNGTVKKMLYTLAFAGLFILLMAIVNFINISISRSGNRMKEIGVRKVLGGVRRQLILQFIAESFIIVTIATLLAIAAYPVFKPLFGHIVGKDIVSLSAFPVYFLFIPILMIVCVGILAGSYPAFVLSSINMVNALKGKLKSSGETVLLRKTLVGFQFCIALIVLIGAAIITQQVSHFFSKSLGYNKEYIVAAQVPRDWSPKGVSKMLAVRDEFAKMPQVSNVSLSYEIPNGNNGGLAPVYKFGTDSTAATTVQILTTDENYASTYQIPLQAGTFFEGRGLDSGKVILNRQAVAGLDYQSADEAIGKQIRVPGDPTIFTIKGVINDFHFGSMQQKVPPIMIFNTQFNIVYRFFSFKIKPGNIVADVEAIQKKWATLLPGTSFEYSFIDDKLKELYGTELQMKKAAYTASVLTFIIALLGVIGLVSLSIHQRVKEIGIRKVLGATASGIVLLFIKEFMLIIFLSALIAFPVIYWLMNNWLNDYAYHISITVVPFVIATVLIVFITVLLIGLQTLKVAASNPVKSLRTE